MAWQPIETADMTRWILVGGNGWVAVATQYHGGRWFTSYPCIVGNRPYDKHNRAYPPTHWMPLPAPPDEVSQ